MKGIDTTKSFEELVKALDLNNLEEQLNHPQSLREDDLHNPDFHGFIRLLTPKTDAELETMAHTASRITRERFGRVIQLYAPLYISNECINGCTYCGFRHDSDAHRVTLTDDEVMEEAEALHETGFRHILLVSGEHRGKVPPERIARLARRVKRRFPSVAIEIYPLRTVEEYRTMVESGVENITLYQETYLPDYYEKYHPSGPKRDYSFRLAALDRAGAAGFARLNVGALLGLAPWRVDSALTGYHAAYLAKKFWKSVVAISTPRMVDAHEGITPPFPANDRALIQAVLSYRIAFPDSPIVVSTREPAPLRNRLALLGATTMSAGSKTEPGGYTHGDEHAERQFEVEDQRTPEEVVEDLKRVGVDPVWKDWDGAIG